MKTLILNSEKALMDVYSPTNDRCVYCGTGLLLLGEQTPLRAFSEFRIRAFVKETVSGRQIWLLRDLPRILI